jgi:hypothetical protein
MKINSKHKIKMRHLLTTIFALTCLSAQSQLRLGYSLPGDSSKISITTKLGIPLGTISKLEAEVYAGDNLHMKAFQGVYLLKINSIDNKTVNDTLILSFTDETGTLANDCFSLYKLVYKKTAGTIPGELINKMGKKYIGKKITIMAYETGQFTGQPNTYSDYKPLESGLPFHFDHSLVIVSNITK